MLNTEKISQLVDSTTSVVSNAVTHVVSNVIATSSRYYSSTTGNYSYGRSGGSCNEKSMAVSILSYGLVTLTSSLLLVQYGTSADPIGRCFLFLKQLRRQVNLFI
jgi:hypothetical protein